MPSNVEIKASLLDPARIRNMIEQMAGEKGVILQEDTFFKVSKGRLKLRRFSPTHGELIFYERPDVHGPKQSDFIKVATENPDALRQVLEQALGIEGVVRKRRELYLLGQTRIHLDEVEGLGNFLELEVVIRVGQKPEEGMVIATDMMERLGIKKEDLIAGAYIDLIKKKNFKPYSRIRRNTVEEGTEKFPRLWVELDATLGETIRPLKGDQDQSLAVQSIAMVKRLMERMEVATADRLADLDVEKYKNFWFFLGLTLDNTIFSWKKNLSRYSFLIPIALVRWLMKKMEES